MGSLLFAGLLLVAILLALALFARGGPSETLPREGLTPELAGLGGLTLFELGSVASRLFSELGFAQRSQAELPGRLDLVMVDPTPVTGQTLYVRCVLPPEQGAVQSAEVQAAMDTARGEQLNKAVVVTSGRFSDEAQLVAQQASLELIDAPKLAELLRARLPDVAHRLGLPR